MEKDLAGVIETVWVGKLGKKGRRDCRNLLKWVRSGEDE